jgi:hypothetical protein
LIDEPIIIFDDYVIKGLTGYPEIIEKSEFIEQYYDNTNRDFEEEVNTKFWQRPMILYHATKDDNVQSILNRGLLAKNDTRGIYNRFIHSAIFTVSDINLLTDNNFYGENIFSINTIQMKKNGFMPHVSIEPSFLDLRKKSYIAAKIGFDEYDGDFIGDSGEWEETFIFHTSIPKEYLTLIGGDNE